MILSVNPITWTPSSEFDFWSFKKSEYYCIDGFPKEDLPCVVIYPPPMITKGKYIY